MIKILYCQKIGKCSNLTNLDSFAKCRGRNAVFPQLLAFLNPQDVEFHSNHCSDKNMNYSALDFDLLYQTESIRFRTDISYAQPFRYVRNCAMYMSRFNIRKQSTNEWYFATPFNGIIWYFLLPIMVYELVHEMMLGTRTNAFNVIRRNIFILAIGALCMLYNSDFTATMALSFVSVSRFKSLTDLNNNIKTGYFTPILRKNLEKWGAMKSVLKNSPRSEFAELYRAISQSGYRVVGAMEVCEQLFHSPRSALIAFDKDRLLLKRCHRDRVSELTLFCYHSTAVAFKLKRGSPWIEKTNRAMPYVIAVDRIRARARKAYLKLGGTIFSEPRQIRLEFESIKNLVIVFAVIIALVVLAFFGEIIYMFT